MYSPDGSIKSFDEDIQPPKDEGFKMSTLVQLPSGSSGVKVYLFGGLKVSFPYIYCICLEQRNGKLVNSEPWKRVQFIEHSNFDQI